MGNFSFIAIIALICYLSMIFMFLAAKKNKLINSFIIVLAVLVFWTAGSLCMRLKIAPGVSFWFYVSINGLFFLAYSFYYFVNTYTDYKVGGIRWLWLGGTLVIALVNTLTGGWFIGAPENTVNDEFVYHMGPQVFLLLLFMAGIIVHMLLILIKSSRENELKKQQLFPITLGIAVLFITNAATLLPVFTGFPIDILGGVVNAFCMFYALYKRRIFKLTLLVSKTSCSIIAGIISALVFAYIIKPLQQFIHTNLGSLAKYDILIIAFSFMAFSVILYSLINFLIDRIFIKEENIKADSLKEFSTSSVRKLSVKEILKSLIETIQKTVDVEKVFICLLDDSGTQYSIVQSSSPLDENCLFIRADNPLVLWLQKNPQFIFYENLKKTSIFRSMWEAEKYRLFELNIEGMLPLVDEDELVGVILLTNKLKNRKYTYNDLSFLESLASISSIVVKNCRLYEKVYREARTDELTGLLNRKFFYEKIEEECLKAGKKELSLVIVNLDDFKLFNQLYGYLEGDKTLQNVAQILSGTIGSKGYVSRLGGKEFSIIMPGCDTLSAKSISETIRIQIMKMNEKNNDYQMKMLTASIGICTYPTAASDAKQLTDNADMAVYNAKRLGKNCIIVYSQGAMAIQEEPDAMTDNFDPSAYLEYEATIYALTAAIDAKDHYTFSHSQNVSYYATELARAYGLNKDCIEIAREAALLHDIGKIGIPEHILNKTGALTKEEYEIMKGHVEQSINIVRHLPSMDYVIPAVLSHHERYDGRGYPRGLAKADIPLLGRILCIVDSFDAMVSKRSYKSSFSLEFALKEIRSSAGTQFDPELAEVFVRLFEEGRIELRQGITENLDN